MGKVEFNLPLAELRADHTMGGRDGRSRSNDGAYFLRARLNVSLPGLARDIAQTLIDGAHATCPYSKATHGNIDVTINLV